MVKDIVVGQRMVLEKNPNWPGIKKSNPDRLIFKRIKEDEARITGLLNGELQIAQFIPPHLLKRVRANSSVVVKETSPVEIMFLAMNMKFKPWDNKKVRQAVAYAINRKAIVKSIFQGGASILHGPVGPGQYGYNPDVTPKYSYNPTKAKQLLAEAGYPNGVAIDFYTANGRYINDRQSSQAIVPMLEAVGFKVKFHTPEYSTHWPLVRKGKRPFYYQGRGSVVDPSAAIAQYFETGVAPRIMYSNPELDKTLAAERQEFDPEKRKKLLLKAFEIIQEDVPAFFLWRINQYYGISKKVDFTPMSTDRIFGVDITVH
jgi:peptide/nickel transport system substrate-binding protein